MKLCEFIPFKDDNELPSRLNITLIVVNALFLKLNNKKILNIPPTFFLHLIWYMKHVNLMLFHNVLHKYSLNPPPFYLTKWIELLSFYFCFSSLFWYFNEQNGTWTGRVTYLCTMVHSWITLHYLNVKLYDSDCRTCIFNICNASHDIWLAAAKITMAWNLCFLCQSPTLLTHWLLFIVYGFCTLKLT